MNQRHVTIAIPISKSAWPKGRIGPYHLQDCHRIQMQGAELVRTGEADIALLMSGVIPKTKEGLSELHYMVQSARECGLKDRRMITLFAGNDTYEQTNLAFSVTVEKHAVEIIVISSILHWPRVRFLFWQIGKRFPQIKVRHRIAWGIPRPREAITDTILIFAYPVIWFIPPLRQWFHKKILERRAKSTL